MAYYYQENPGVRHGPYTRQELVELHLHGVIRPDTIIFEDNVELPTPFRELWLRWRAPQPGSAPAGARAGAGSFAERAGADLRMLTPHLLVPLDGMKSLRWLENRRLLWITGVGLIPLAVIAFFLGNSKQAYWGMAFYFAALWASFFYYLFPSPEVRLSTSCLCFFGAGVISISIVLLLYLLPPFSSLVQLVEARSLFKRMLGYVLGVGVPEELCKVFMLVFILRHSGPHSPQAMLFYGLMAGLGFGIYEGVDYQIRRNQLLARHPAASYLLNLIRLTTLPFLHAIWTGIAGYFLGFAARYPERKRGLFIVAIGVPALLHGLYDTFAESALGLVFALLSVLALNLYLAKSVDLTRALGPAAPPASQP